MYGYIERGKLPARRLGSIIVLLREDLSGFERSVVGRPRRRTTVWRTPVVGNPQYLLSVRVRLKEDQQEAFRKKLVVLRKQKKHQFPGTVARYISYSQQDLSLVQITLVWRYPSMPSDEEREKTLNALRADFEDLFEWEYTTILEGPVDLNA